MAKPVVDLPGEIWKPVVGYEGIYEVSNLGRVRSLDRVFTRRSGRPQPICGRILRLILDRDGRPVVNASARGVRRRLYVHRLVLAAFVGPCPDGNEACHNDGNPGNNHLENLRWDTRKGNCADRAKHGTTARGRKNGNAKLTEGDVRAIRARCESGETQQSVAADYGVQQAHVSSIASKKVWAHI